MNAGYPLGQLNLDEFLDTYWQKRPVLIRQAFPNFESPIEPNDLAGLSTEEGVLSRLILEKGGEYPWQMRQGPFQDKDFEELSEAHWTVLVQEVDKHVPAVADLFDRFSFLPNWRKDDVMVSFAAKDAGVGAHIDSYDVFLLQGSGRRRWEIGEPDGTKAPSDGGLRASGSASGGPAEGHLDCDNSQYVQGLDVRMLANFVPTEVFELEPGDMLYLPPGIPHNGVSIEPCLTYSFGFLAPKRADISGELADWQSEKLGAVRYRDPQLKSVENPGFISPEDIERVIELVQKTPLEPEVVAEWFGEFITRPQRAPAETEEFEGSFEDFWEDFQDCGLWRRHEGVRLAVWPGATTRLFVDGSQYSDEVSLATLTLLGEKREFEDTVASANHELRQVLYEFTCKGWGYLVPEEDENE